MPDLTVSVRAPASAHAGAALGTGTVVVARNAGTATAAGTAGSLSPQDGYVIDLVLSKDDAVPTGLAPLSTSYRDDALLVNGRAQATHDLPAEGSHDYAENDAVVPADAPAGEYQLCAQIDPKNDIAESNEGNNIGCARLKVLPPVAAIDVSGILPPLPRGEKPGPRLRAPLPVIGEGCPDPAVVTLRADLVRTYHSLTDPREVTGGLVEVVGVVRNVGSAPFESGRGLQEARLTWSRPTEPIRTLLGDVPVPGAGTAAVEEFRHLNIGEELRVQHRTSWSISQDAELSFAMEISYDYDPGVGVDRLSVNDDCNLRNNRLELRPEEIQRLF